MAGGGSLVSWVAFTAATMRKVIQRAIHILHWELHLKRVTHWSPSLPDIFIHIRDGCESMITPTPFLLSRPLPQALLDLA
jgi:hypothetical protein